MALELGILAVTIVGVAVVQKHSTSSAQARSTASATLEPYTTYTGIL